MSNDSAYIKVTLTKGKLFTGRLRQKGTIMSLPLDAARKLVANGEAEITKEEIVVTNEWVIDEEE